MKQTTEINLTYQAKKPNWQEADQLALYKGSQDLSWTGDYPEQIQLVVRAGPELGSSDFKIWRPYHSATIPPFKGGLNTEMLFL